MDFRESRDRRYNGGAMNIGIRDKNDNMIFVGNTLVRRRDNGEDEQVFEVAFGYFCIGDDINYGVFLADTETNDHYSFPFFNGTHINLINLSRL